MTIDLLYFAGCPNYEALLPRLRALLSEAGIDGEVRLVRVESEGAARAARFLGSPSVRIAGRDVDPSAEGREDFGLKCRLYQTPAGLSGVPPDEWVLAALARHITKNVFGK